MAETIDMLVRGLILVGRLRFRFFLRSLFFVCIYFFTFEQVDMRSLWLEGRSFESFCYHCFLCVFFVFTFHRRFDITYLSCGDERTVGTIIAIEFFLLMLLLNLHAHKSCALCGVAAASSRYTQCVCCMILLRLLPFVVGLPLHAVVEFSRT